MKHIWSFGILLKRVGIFVASVLFIFFVYQSFIPDVWRSGNVLLSLMILWFVTAYLVLPRVHRFLSQIYVPDHFIGRSRTSDGILSDPVNLAINSSKEDLVQAMEAAGWVMADKLSIHTAWRTMKSVVFQKSYPSAPVSDAFMFGVRQTLAFQIEVDNNPNKRHHVRFWKTPKNWYLPGGYKVDWLGAATYDESVGLSLFTMQFTHAISSNIDEERDFLISSLKSTKSVKTYRKIKHFFNAYESRNGFGHQYITDGSMVVVELKNTDKKKK